MTLRGALVAQEPFNRSGRLKQPLPLSRSLHSPGRLSLFHWRMPGLSWPLPYGLIESRLGVFRFCRLISRRTGLFVRYAFRQSLTVCNALRLAGVFP